MLSLLLYGVVSIAFCIWRDPLDDLLATNLLFFFFKLLINACINIFIRWFNI